MNKYILALLTTLSAFGVTTGFACEGDAVKDSGSSPASEVSSAPSASETAQGGETAKEASGCCDQGTAS